MNASSSSLPTGWITVWITLGVVTLGLFIALPLAVSQKLQKELVRFQACSTMTQRTDCEPSLAWAMSGWSLTSSTTPVVPPTAATSTGMAAATSTDSVSASSTQTAR